VGKIRSRFFHLLPNGLAMFHSVDRQICKPEILAGVSRVSNAEGSGSAPYGNGKKRPVSTLGFG